ncbi:MAG: hypothetical protein ACLS34_02675 [Faecalibacterium sp.]
MSEKISRRNFLRTATLGAAAAGLLAGCGNSAASGSTAASTAAGTYTAGTYSATATGINTTTPGHRDHDLQRRYHYRCADRCGKRNQGLRCRYRR